MNEKAEHLRDFGSALFTAKEVDVEKLRSELGRERKADDAMGHYFPGGRRKLDSLTTDTAVQAFNQVLDSDFYKRVDAQHLKLSDSIHELLERAHQIPGSLTGEDRRRLNRSILHALYPATTLKIRRFERISAQHVNINIRLIPLVPKRPSYDGKLVDISPGGMALLLSQKLPEGSYWALRTKLTKGSNMETLVQMLRAHEHGRHVLHGFRFASIQNFLTDKVKGLAGR